MAIYQEPMIFPDLSVAENIFIGHRERGQVVRWRKMYDEAAAILRSLDIDLDPRGAGQHADRRRPAGRRDRQGDLARRPGADHGRADRRAVGPRGRAGCSARSRGSRERGVAVLFISHRLDEVFRIADRITVFRDGRHISTRPPADVSTTSCSCARWSGARSATSSCAPVTRRARWCCGSTDLGRAGTFEDVSFDVRAGEVVGLAGLVGAGRTDVGLALFGIAPAEQGTIARRRAGRCPSPARATRMSLGIAYLSEDRRKLGLSLPQSVTSNITLPRLGSYRTPFGLARPRAERATAEEFRTA